MSIIEEKWFTKMPIAHRGWHWEPGIDENSWEAIELANEKGFPIEFDVHLSKDGVPFIHHDLSLKRMTGRDIEGVNLDSFELREIKSKNSSRGIPILSEVLEKVRGQVPLVIELKRSREDFALEKAVFDIVKNYKGDFSIQGFHPGTLNFFRQKKVNFPLGLLSGSLDDENLNFFIKIMLKSLSLSPFLKPDYIGYEYKLLSKRAPQYIREHYQIPLIGWTVRDELAEQFCRRYADNIIFENLKLPS